MAVANPLNFIGENEEWCDFVNRVSSNTGTFYERLWLENTKANKPLIKKYGWVSEALQGTHKGKTTVLLGASPAIKNQVETLKKLQGDPDFILIGLSSNIDFLLENELYPDYMMIAEADPETERFWTNTDFNKTKDITLIANICTHPFFLDKWKGDIKFLAIYTMVKKLDKKFAKWFYPINGCGYYFLGLMSQYNTGAAVAFTIFESEILIFVGNELSYKDMDQTYYVDRADLKDKWEKHPQIDINGNKVYTTYMLMSLKFTLEDFLGKLSGAGWFFNCTEAGIFGVSAKFGNLPWIQQLKLTTGIAQARNIMQTGEPFLL
jgi:hypothetical protein